MNRRLGAVVTLLLCVLWLGLVFMPGGVGHRFATQVFAKADSSYLRLFGWEDIAGGSSVLHDAASRQMVDVVVFIDYGCPFCRDAEPIIDSLQDSDITFLVGYRHVLPARSATSRLAAVAAVCAHRSGLFAAVHDSLYSLVDNTSDSMFLVHFTDVLSRYASEREVLSTRNCVESPPQPVLARLHRDSVLTARLGLHSTPTFIGANGSVSGLTTLDGVRAIGRIPSNK